ncbi:MAG: LicD family protein [Lachnospiraceae bacterium]|nr:LicD family protein [Lachnospiraceae bacterium]
MEEKRKIILFGAGRDGKEALDFFGKDNVSFYIDNDEEKRGTVINGIKIISYTDLKSLYEKCMDDFTRRYEVIITVNVTRWATFAVAHQLRKIGIENFNVYRDVKKRWKSGREFLDRDMELYPCEQESILEVYKYQLDWMIRHTAALDLKPATGKFREKQMKIMDGLKWLLKKTEALNIKFIMNHGTLLGAIRHHGFIPWDDDMDLALVAEDYDKFIIFCEKAEEICVFYNCYNGEYRTKEGKKTVSPDEYPYIMAIGWGYIQFFRNVGKKECKENEIITDIMPMYNIRNDITIENFMEEHNCWLAKRKEDFDMVDRFFKKGEGLEFITTESTRQIGYTFDFTSFFDWFHAKTGRTMKRALWEVKDLYPLQKLNFEDIQMWAPGNAMGWLEQLNPGMDMMKIPPKSVGIPVHDKNDIFTEKY